MRLLKLPLKLLALPLMLALYTLHILFGVEAVCVALQFSVMFLVELAGEWAGSLGAFLHS